MLELWATGFNAWGQLDFASRTAYITGDTAHENASPLPRDLKTFRCVVEIEDHAEILRTSESATALRCGRGVTVAGCPDELTEHSIVELGAGPVFAVAGNNIVSEYTANTRGYAPSHANAIAQYDSFTAYKDATPQSPAKILAYIAGIAHIAANQTSFTALSRHGQVWTWGDPRFEACLGREVNRDAPPQEPRLVQDLLDLPTGPIRKVCSGGYVTAALTAGNDLYVWGGRAGERKLLEQLSDRPTPVDLEGEDILDVGVGFNHMIALTTGRRLFVVGQGKNGQLGSGHAELHEDWTEVPLPLKDGQEIVSVHAGYKNTFLLVKDKKLEEQR